MATQTYKQFTHEEKLAIGEMMTQWGKTITAPIKAGTKDEMNVKALHEMIETKVLIDALKAVGVESSGHLMDMGFVAAGLVLRFK